MDDTDEDENDNDGIISGHHFRYCASLVSHRDVEETAVYAVEK